MQNGFKKYDLVLVNLGDAVLSGEQGGVRPAVIMQNDIGNIYSPATIVIPFTTKCKNLHQPTHLLFKKNVMTGLAQDSMILGECMRNISEKRIIKKLGHFDCDEDRRKINKAKNAAFGD